ncbi:MAG TPA: alpha/beta hydrolase [Gaiellaceae bacterium]|nr:alpha/beta hydrolase [Gaiellaceae bacterium]
MSAVSTASTESPQLARYRAAERALWSHYGLAPTERFVELDSPPVRLRITELGSGPPLVFVHGTAGTGPVWAPLLRELSGFRCLLVDRPGWGFSSPLDYSQHEYGTVVADVLRGVLDALDLERADLVGASIGDLWALRTASAYPQRVERVVLLGGGPLVSEIEVPPFIRLVASPLGAVIVRLPLKPGRVRAILRDAGHAVSLEEGRIPDVFVDWRASLGRDTDSMKHERNMVQAIVAGRGFRPGLTLSDAELAAVEQPTLLAYGTADRVGTVETWKRAVDLIPGGELLVIEGGGHMPWLDDPERVAERMHRFLDRNGRGGASQAAPPEPDYGSVT